MYICVAMTTQIKVERFCITPGCHNTSLKTPQKLFFPVPQDEERRKQWFIAICRKPTLQIMKKSGLYICEDHFIVEEDVEDFYKNRLGGHPMKLKDNVVPHRYICQVEKNKSNDMKRSNQIIVKKALQKIEEENLLPSIRSKSWSEDKSVSGLKNVEFRSSCMCNIRTPSSSTMGRIENMEARAEHLKTRNYRTVYLFATTLGVGLIIMVLTWCLKYRGGFSWTDPKIQFNWHPFLMMIGMVFLYGQSILVYRTGRNFSKKRLKNIHAILHSIVFILIVIALKAAFDSHNYAKTPIPNLYTMHSWLGLTAVILFTGQGLIGFVAFKFPGLSKSLRSTILPVHTAVGAGIFILVLLTVLSGLTEKTVWTLGTDYQSLPGEGVLVNFIAVFGALFGILVLYLVHDPDYKRSNLPEDEVALSHTDQ